MRRLSGSNSIGAAGTALAGLGLGLDTIQPPVGHVYAALQRDRLTWRDPSELARRDDVMRSFWRDSATLVGLDDIDTA
jgi:hypothetical protein